MLLRGSESQTTTVLVRGILAACAVESGCSPAASCMLVRDCVTVPAAHAGRSDDTETAEDRNADLERYHNERQHSVVTRMATLPWLQSFALFPSVLQRLKEGQAALKNVYHLSQGLSFRR